MSRKKVESRLIGEADKRLVGLKTIDPALVLDGGVGVKSLTAARDGLGAHLEEYNTLLTKADVAHDALEHAEKVLKDQLERTLAGVAAKYGKDSEEYKQAGGVKKSEKKHPHRSPKTPPASPEATPPPLDAKEAS